MSHKLRINDVLDYVVKARDAGKLHSSWTREVLGLELVQKVAAGEVAVALDKEDKLVGIMAFGPVDKVKKELFVDNFIADNAEARHALYVKTIQLCGVELNSGWKFTGKSRKTGRPRLIPITSRTFKYI